MCGMCVMCDGMSYEDALQDLIDRKEKWGWALQGVEARPPWTYTIGLLERFDHPELVMTGVPITVAFNVLNVLGTRIAVGERFEPGTEDIVVGETALRFVAVHGVHLAAGLVGMWQNAYSTDPGMLERLAVVQALVLPVGRQPRLDRAFTTLPI